MEYDYNDLDRYSRHALYYALSGANPCKVQEKLLNKHVLIVGCGGIGTQVSCALATAGVGKLTLLDFDIIEVSNLTRQILFTEFDEGKYKTEILKRELLKRNNLVKINTIHRKVNSFEEQLPECDLAILSADTHGLVTAFNKYAIKNNVPFLNVGYINDIAVWGPFVIPGKTGCLACRQIAVTEAPKEDLDIWKDINLINSEYQAPSIGGINMLAASFAVLDALKYLGEFGEIASLNKRVCLWTHKLSIEYQDCSKNNFCEVCGNGCK